MSRLEWTLVLSCAVVGLTGMATAQDGTMSGQVVSNTAGENVRLIGNDLPQVAKPVGKPVNLPNNNPLFRPYNPANPYESLEGTGLSAKSVVAPVNGYQTEVQPSVFQQFTNGVKSILGLTTPPVVQRNFTPGIYRRDRQRVQERMWVRD